MKISVVSPVYKAEHILTALIDRIKKSITVITEDFEIILVDDGSPDKSWLLIESLCEIDPRIKGIKLSRNFGQHVAITAGLNECKGEWIVVMDCDLQDRPEEIINLYNKVNEIGDLDYIQAQRINRRDSFFRIFMSKTFSRILSFLNDHPIDGTIANFGIYNKKVINAVLLMPEKIRWFPSLVQHVGFNGAKLKVEHGQRENGQSSYSLKKLIKISMDVFLLNSERPMRLIAQLGLIIFISTLLYSFYILYQYLVGDITVLGYTSLIISVLLCSGIIIFFIGIVGLYTVKIFQQVKDRPLYIIKEKINS